MNDKTDTDLQETKEWIESLEAVIENSGNERAHFLVEQLVDTARRVGVNIPYSAKTAYINTIPSEKETYTSGDPAIEGRIRSIIRWNALAMVVRANRKNSELGGHIASYASAATLYDVGYNHFWRGFDGERNGDLVFFQGHSAPGVYARAFLLGLISEDQLDNFRQECNGNGLSSYPHPWLMPEFWQFPTVSMGLGPIMAIYQARFMKYLENRSLENCGDRKVWAFMGDGEMDEPEAFGAAALASREKLDNLIFVINCNLQRLDGPVRGNGKIIQELESDFRGAGWNVIKVVWGSYWDPLLAKDSSGKLVERMEEAVDGEYQAYKANDGAFVRQHFFGKHDELKKLVSNLSDEDIWRLNRGGHDPHKVFAAYHQASNHRGQPTVILCKTVKGYGMGDAGEGKNITHQQKKMNLDSLKHFRDKFKIPISDDEIEDAPYYKPDEQSEEMLYVKERTRALGGFIPKRRIKSDSIEVPEISLFESILEGSGERSLSTTMIFVRILNILVKHEKIGNRIVPIVPDEARTFGMEGMFRQLGIYSADGQLYEPVDHDELMYYREDKKGQILEEGITEAGAMCSWIAAATSYSCHNKPMIPFYIFYSMFGFQRIGDLAWAAGDMQARGFLLGGTAGRTTLAGEGLQHQDGHSHLLASTIPNCVSYDPTFGYELAVIIQNGMERMFQNQENIFFYITVMNENYNHPKMPERVEKEILAGMYLFQEAEDASIQLLGSGTILREVIDAAKILDEDYGIVANVWSVTSFNELRKNGLDTNRWNLLNPSAPKKQTFVEKQLAEQNGPCIAATDYMRTYADQIREFVPQKYYTLGTDGYGRSDSRQKLREHFEVNSSFIVFTAMKALYDSGDISIDLVNEVMERFSISYNKKNPYYS